MKHLLVALVALFLISVPQGALAQAVKCQQVFTENILATMPAPAILRYGLPKNYTVEDFTEHTMARTFVEYAVRNMLLNQNAESLAAKGLLLPNGGLCSSTCLINVFGAMTAQGGDILSFLENAPKTIDLIANAHKKNTGIDIRMGIDVKGLVKTVNNIFGQVLHHFQYDLSFETIDLTTSHINSRLMTYHLEKALEDDALAIATIRKVTHTSDKERYHAIVILKVDRTLRKIYFSDPNRPNLITIAPYTPTDRVDGIIFNVPTTYGDQAVQFVAVDVFTRVIRRQR